MRLILFASLLLLSACAKSSKPWSCELVASPFLHTYSNGERVKSEAHICSEGRVIDYMALDGSQRHEFIKDGEVWFTSFQ